MAEIKEKAKGIGDRVAGMAHEAKDAGADMFASVKEGAKAAFDKTSEMASDAKEKVQHFASDAYGATADTVKTLGKDVTKLIRDYPVAAILVGLGVGILLGRSSRS